MILGLGQGNYTMILEYLVVLEVEEVLKQTNKETKKKGIIMPKGHMSQTERPS